MPPVSDRSRLISIVQSRQNARVRELRAAFTRSSREVSDVIGIEGEHLLAEGLRSGVRLRAVFLRTEPENSNLRVLERLDIPSGIPIVSLNPVVFASAVDTESPQGIAAIIETPRFSLAEALSVPRPLLVIAAAVQDPGNFGTLIRSAEAFGANGVIALPGTVSIWNSKALRASAGSAFRIPVVAEKASVVLSALAERKIPVLAAVPASADPDALPCWRADLTGPVAFLVGNEGSGISADLLERTAGCVSIPTPGPVESLNAAVAASILLYEASRQRSAQGVRQ
jgi:RNA methyltransferase, TrmH family